MSKVATKSSSSKRTANGGLAWIEQAFAGMREQTDHLHVLLCDALSDFPPQGIDECAAYSLEQIARWAMQFRSGLFQVREELERDAGADAGETSEPEETVTQ